MAVDNECANCGRRLWNMDWTVGQCVRCGCELKQAPAAGTPTAPVENPR